MCLLFFSNRKKSSADGKDSNRNPFERRSLPVEFLINSSSSTITISGFSSVLLLWALGPFGPFPIIENLCPTFLRDLGRGSALAFGIGSWRICAVNPKLFRSPDQVSEQARPHFFHDMGAVGFNRGLGRVEFAGGLFVQNPAATRVITSRSRGVRWS